MKKIFVAGSAVFVALCYWIGMSTSDSSKAYAALSNYIMKPYYGSYYLNGNQSGGQWFNINKTGSSITSVFRGEYTGYGFVACSELNSNESLYNSGLEGSNLTLYYKQWAQLVGDSYVAQSGKLLVMGYLRTEKEGAKFSVGSDVYTRV